MKLKLSLVLATLLSAAFFAPLRPTFAAAPNALSTQGDPLALTLFYGGVGMVSSPASRSGAFGGGFSAHLEWKPTEDFLYGVQFLQFAFTDSKGTLTAGSIDATLRYYFARYRNANFYGLVGAGPDLFSANLANPLGMGFHAQTALGISWVLNDTWAIDSGFAWHFKDPDYTLPQFAELRIGFNYQWGRQPLPVDPEIPALRAAKVQVVTAEDIDNSEAEALRLDPKNHRIEIVVRPGESLWDAAHRALGKDAVAWLKAKNLDWDMITKPQPAFFGRTLVLSRYGDAKEWDARIVGRDGLVLEGRVAESDFAQHIIRRGESLWRLAGKTEYMGNPETWPIIYDENNNKIKNPNRILVGQEIRIRRGVSAEEKAAAIRRSRLGLADKAGQE